MATIALYKIVGVKDEQSEKNKAYSDTMWLYQVMRVCFRPTAVENTFELVSYIFVLNRNGVMTPVLQL